MGISGHFIYERNLVAPLVERSALHIFLLEVFCNSDQGVCRPRMIITIVGIEA